MVTVWPEGKAQPGVPAERDVEPLDSRSEASQVYVCGRRAEWLNM